MVLYSRFSVNFSMFFVRARTHQPHIRIWNSVSLATVAIIGSGDFTGSVNSLCFSRADSGSMLVAIDDSSDKVISVWEWQRGEKGHKVTETRVRLAQAIPMGDIM